MKESKSAKAKVKASASKVIKNTKSKKQERCPKMQMKMLWR
jgi:hypothetical protein